MANVVILLLHWSATTVHLRFTAAILLLLVPQPWGFTIREHLLLRRSGVIASDELKRKVAAGSLASTTVAYMGLFVAIEALKLSIG
jgi:hypothetical protein